MDEHLMERWCSSSKEGAGTKINVGKDGTFKYKTTSSKKIPVVNLLGYKNRQHSVGGGCVSSVDVYIYECINTYHIYHNNSVVFHHPFLNSSSIQW